MNKEATGIKKLMELQKIAMEEAVDEYINHRIT
jgi:hypothetical protein